MSSRSRGQPKPKSRPAPRNSNIQGQSRISSVSMTDGLLSVDFEIRGTVQGVHFRKYTQSKALSFGIRGWVKNTERGSVVGCMQGERLKIDMMKDWLKRIGSPKSKIDGADFKNTKSITDFDYNEFQIVK